MLRPFDRVDAAVWVPGVVWGASAYALHKAGALAGWYGAYPWFQNLTHAASASGVALLCGLVGLELGYRGRRLLGFAVALTVAGALGWEAIEYLGWLDGYGVYLHFHGVHDAAVDMASNAVGTAAALTALWWWTGLAPATPRDREPEESPPYRRG